MSQSPVNHSRLRNARSVPGIQWFLFLLLAVLITSGLLKLRLDTDVLGLLPETVPEVQALRIQQEHFADRQELVVLCSAPDRERLLDAAGVLASRLEGATGLVQRVAWRSSGKARSPESIALIAYLWFNQPQPVFEQWMEKLEPDKVSEKLGATMETLRTELNPQRLLRLSRDPLELVSVPPGMESDFRSSFQTGSTERFASEDGRLRILLVRSAVPLTSYTTCRNWLQSIRHLAEQTLHQEALGDVEIGFTGPPAFASEIASGMQRDMTVSVGSAFLFITLLFGWMYRDWLPLSWLLALLGVILVALTAFGGLIYNELNVISIGFAAILLGLAVDYAFVLYHEWLGSRDQSTARVRKEVGPGILWAALTTAAAFASLNFGGLPGLSQLGTLVALGVLLAAVMMVLWFLVPLNRQGQAHQRDMRKGRMIWMEKSLRYPVAALLTATIILASLAVTLLSPPKVDVSANALRHGGIEASRVMERAEPVLGKNGKQVWMVVQGNDVADTAQLLQRAAERMSQLSAADAIDSFNLPVHWWPHPAHQQNNRNEVLPRLLERWREARQQILKAGFNEESLAAGEAMMEFWTTALHANGWVIPQNELAVQLFDSFAALEVSHPVALGTLNLKSGSSLAESRSWYHELSEEGLRFTNWSMLGAALFDHVRTRLIWMACAFFLLLVLLLLLVFRSPGFMLLSLMSMACSFLLLQGAMILLGWEWNLMNLMMIPLLLGTGIDYSLHLLLAMRRHRGDAERVGKTVGRALFLCAATTVVGFGSLGWSENNGLASLGKVGALGVGINAAVCVFLLPAWVRQFYFPALENFSCRNRTSNLRDPTKNS